MNVPANIKSVKKLNCQQRDERLGKGHDAMSSKISLKTHTMCLASLNISGETIA